MSMPSTAKQLVAQLRQKGINNELVLDAIEATPRHLFIDPALRDKAYWDQPLSLSYGQTISQPFVVARMTELILAGGSLEKVLEIGTGSGYQAAVLAHLVPEVYSIERIYPLYVKACESFHQLKLTNIFTRFDDGREGWPEKAPFDGVIVTAAAEEVPPQLLVQLREGGKMIIPVGNQSQQQLQLITRQGERFLVERLDPVIFVPLLLGTQS